MNRSVVSLIRGIIILTIPIFLVLTSARALLSNAYLRYEYGKANFPADPYGFTQAQRYDLASVAIQFLWSPDPPEIAIEMLRAQRLPGTDEPLYNFYELSHMVDVKQFTDRLWRFYWMDVAVLLGGIITLLLQRSTRQDVFLALYGGGLLTVGLLLVLSAFVLLSWRTFFIQFHELFFAAGTWTFDWSDSLIREFPDKFWFDAGTIICVGTLLAGIVVAAVGRLASRRPAIRSKRAAAISS